MRYFIPVVVVVAEFANFVVKPMLCHPFPWTRQNIADFRDRDSGTPSPSKVAAAIITICYWSIRHPTLAHQE
jgi:hypothetical protein